MAQGQLLWHQELSPGPCSHRVLPRADVSSLLPPCCALVLRVRLEHLQVTKESDLFDLAPGPGTVIILNEVVGNFRCAKTSWL